jgi:hydroxymethylpyrimidine pyrophosphatase-like HAD family hydrolase
MLKTLPSSSDDVEALRPFARVELIAADLDGTLFPASLVEKIQNAIRSLRHYRVRFTLATGRTFGGARELSDKLRLPRGTPVVLYNGSVVVEADSGRLLRRAHIAPVAVMRVLAVAGAYRCDVFGYMCEYPLEAGVDGVAPVEQVIGWRFGSWGTKPATVDFNRSRIRWQTPREPAATCAPSAILVTAEEPQALDGLANELNDIADLTVTRSGSAFLELRPPNSDKAVGLSCAATHVNVTAPHVLAIGDNDNDAEMLQWAGIGVVISQASPMARFSADYVCRRNTFEGVVEVLNVVRNAKRYFPIHRAKAGAV